jgi:CubicO group peptidase (beta-lactamase class C family)
MIPFRIAALLTASALASIARADPAPLPRGTPEAQGISSAALLAFVGAAEQRIDALHSFMLLRHGHVVAEGWWAPYAASEPHSLYSLSKSFTSTAVGLAVAEGKLSVDDPVLKFFPGEAPATPTKNLSSMRIRDLLRMSSGQRAEDLKGFPFNTSADLVRTFLELPVPDKPGTHFVYNTAATYMLSAIVQKVTGQAVEDYLGPRLFGPLGISRPTWEKSAQGISLGGYGLSIRTEDIARFGQLYLQRGQWAGRQLVPAAWVDAATSLQTANGSDPSSDWDQGYGYQFWRCRHGFYRGDGAFGQFCVVMAQYDAVLAVTAATRDLSSVLNLVWERIVPAFNDGPLAADPENDQKLARKLASLSLPTQAGQPGSPVAARIGGRRYVFPVNAQRIESVELEPGAEVSIQARVAGSDERITFGRGSWVKGTLAGATGDPVPIAACGAWSSDDTYTAMVCRYRTPFITTYDLRFSGDTLILEAEDNVALDTVRRIRLVGTARP